MPTFLRIWKKKSVEAFSPSPYLFGLLNCVLWFMYGLPMVQPHCILVATVNGTGALIELFYVVVFSCFSGKQKRLLVLVLMLLDLLFASGVAAFVLTVIHGHERRARIVGSLSVSVSSLMYAAPLGIMKMVIKTRSVEYLPLILSLTSLANGLCWTIYGLIHLDVIVIIPNALGSFFGFIQLILHAVFYKSTKRQIEERKAKGAAGLAEIVFIGGPQESLQCASK